MGYDKGIKGEDGRFGLILKGIFEGDGFLSWCVDELAITGRTKIEQMFGFCHPHRTYVRYNHGISVFFREV